MRRLITIFLTIFAITFINAKIPRVFVSIKQKDIKADEKLEIMVGAEAKKGSKFKFPKVDEIGGYKVISQKSSVSYRVDESNGKKVPLVKRAVTYIIKPTKSFDIGSFTLKINNQEFKTVPFRVKVLDKKTTPKKEKSKIQTQTKTQMIKAPKASKEAKKDVNKTKVITPKENNTLTQNIDFIFKMSANKKEVVVGESFIVRVELIEPINLSSSDLQYTPPKFTNFDVKPIGDGKIEESTDRVIRTIEYLLIPKKSGKFTISPAKAKIGIQLTPQVQSPFGFFGTDIEWKKISTNKLTIRVKPAPKGVDLVGKFKLEVQTDDRAKANRPYNYIVKIIGLGDLDNFKLPDIKIDNITTYKEEPKIEHILTKGVVVSKLIQKYVFIADRDFAIPSITIKAYNPDSKKIYKLKTKPLIVRIKRANSISSILNKTTSTYVTPKTNTKNQVQKQSINSTSQIASKPQDIKKVEELLLDKYYYKRKYSNGYPLSAIFGALALGLILGAGAVILIPGLFRVTKNGKLTSKNRLFEDYEEALNILYPHTTKSKNIEKMVANLYEVTNGNKDVKIDDYALNKMIKRVKEGK